MAEAYILDSPNVALTATTARSVLLGIAGSTQPFRVIQFAVSLDATASGTCKVEFLVGTTSGGTTSTAPNIARMNGESFNKAAISTASMYSAEPTYTKYSSNGNLVIKTMMLILPTSPFEIEYPLGREFFCPESNSLAIRLTASVGCNAYTSLSIEE
jgi:hypothetical protein